MHANDFLSGYAAKLLEYGLAVAYLVLFVGFWRYVQGGKKAAVARVAEARPSRAASAATGWFAVPADVDVHPGHTWARLEADGTVSVGLDDLGHRLIGEVDRIELPVTGARVEQGEAAVRLGADGRAVGLLSPVDGDVVSTNQSLSSAPGRFAEPYGQGWLFRVRPTRWSRNRAQLLSGQAARDWIEEQGRLLSLRLSPQPVPMLQDGGAPVHGIARELDPQHWDDVAREFFRTQDA
jgi:glycine cleavage system H lipoate-binding protein